MDLIVAAHVVGIVVWIGALMMLSRMLGMHAELEPDAVPEALKKFEHRTYFWASAPAMLLTFATGFYMLFFKGASVGHYLNPSEGAWGATFHLKLTSVFLLFVADHFVMRRMRKLHKGEGATKKPFQIAHGMIGVLFVVIIVAVKTNLLG